MNKNYMIYPLKNIRITQSYDGAYSHLKHITGYPKDYPIDDGGLDTGVDAIYCPCDEMKVTQIKGVGNKNITNTIWLVSTSPVVTPTFTDYAFITLTHSNDSDIQNIKIGDKFIRGEVICHEGKDGALSNHIHITQGRGSSDNFEKNTTGAWVMSGNTKKPEEIFFLSREFNNVIDTKGIKFTYLPDNYVGSTDIRDKTINQLEIIVDNLRAREEASISGKILGYARSGIYTYSEKVVNDNYTWYKINDFFVAYNPNWIKLLEAESPNTTTSQPSNIKHIFTSLEAKKYIIYLDKGRRLYIDN